MKTLSEIIFIFGIRERRKILFSIQGFYIIFSFLILFAFFQVYHEGVFSSSFLSFSTIAGKIAIVFYLASLVPGIARRLRMHNKIIAVFMMYRRHIGVVSFFFMLYHYMMERGVNLIRFGFPRAIPLTEFFGSMAFFFAFLLTVTSNDISTKTMGIWWKRLHALTYAMVWLILFHVVLHRISVWGVLLFLFGALEGISFIYHKSKRKM